jgi:hypothetical protein
MPDTGEYRAHAAKCVRLAQQTSDPATLVYETPEPRQQVAQQQQQPQPKK